MRGGIGVRGAQLAIVALCAAAAVFIFLIALDTTPIADDYGDLPSIMHAGVFQYLHSYWVGLTDRYSNAVFMVVLVKLFGAAAIHIATPLLIALLAWFCVAIARRISTGPDRGYGALVVGCLAAITIAVSTPSIFDTLGWFNAVSIYLAGLVAAVGTAAWMVCLAARRATLTSHYVIASFVLGLVAAGFTELIGMVIVLGSVLAIVNVRDLLPSGSRRRSLEIVYLAITAGALVGVIVIFLGPGSRSRFHLQRGGFDVSLIASAVRANLGWASTNFGWRALMSVASGLALLHFRGAPRSQRSLRWLATWAVFLCCAPILVVGVATGYSGVLFAPLRAASVATAAIAVGEALIAYLLAVVLVQARQQLASVLLPAAAVAAAAGLVGFGIATAPVIQAERLRQTAVHARAQSIHRQLRQHRRSVSVMPAPLIDFYEQAYDLFFEHKAQLGYVLAGIHQYYGIPQDVRIHVIATQPRDYCLPHLSVPAYGVKACDQIGPTRGRTDH